jgi:hypothetical protein
MNAIVEKVEKDVSWLRTHERLIIILAVLLAAVYLGSLWMNHSSDSAVAANAIAQQDRKEQTAQNVEIAKQVIALQQQYQQMMVTLSAQNAAINSAINQRQIVVQQQQKVDQTLPLPDLAKRWEKLVDLQPSDIQATDKGLTVTDAGSRETVKVLETVPALKQEVKDTQQIVENKNAQVEGLTGLVTSRDTEIVGLKAEVSKADAACKTTLDLEKTKARKSKVKWFVGGVITGAAFVVRFLV